MQTPNQNAMNRYLVLVLAFLFLSENTTAQDYVNTAASFTSGSASADADYTNISSFQQPVSPTYSTGDEYINHSGFLTGFIELSESDIDGDGLVDPLDPDNDNDGIPDTHEISGVTFTPPTPTDPNKADTDLDGSSDMAEYLFGHDPTNANSHFQIFLTKGISDDIYQLTFQALNERKYTIQYSDDLLEWNIFTNESSGEWIESRVGANTYTFVDDFTLETSGTAPENGARFYRILVEEN